MSRVFREEDFVQYNGFYGKPICRSVVFHLYEGECATCRCRIEGDNFHVAHIISRTHPKLMGEYFSDLDVDNLINLKLSCPRCNIKESNFVINSIMMQGVFNFSARIISSRLDAVLVKLNAVRNRIEMINSDPRICTDLLHIEVDEILALAVGWRGAWIVSRAALEARAAEAVKNTLGNDGNSADAYHAVEDGIVCLRNRMEIKASSGYSFHSDGSLPWLTEAMMSLRLEGKVGDISERIRAAGLVDGVYLDPVELIGRGGLVFPIRTAVQRWFRDMFATIIYASRMLERSEVRRYHAIGERDWHNICSFFDKLGLIESGIGKTGRRLRLPDIVSHFEIQKGRLYFSDDDISVPDDVRRMCHAIATDSIWGNGALILKSKFRPWLTRAFSIVDLAVREAVGSQLVLVDDKGSGWRRWMPRLPKLDGQTLEDIRLESAERLSRRRRKT
ncbi:HNH endonuclease signature motif containing protein [Burkholderia sp. 567]|uniref:HNH endonuclease signature motif containing protein n=1 Tax=Burkholderia sp. 567 TaxID=3156413 RepID=UPI00339B94DE